jgi:hypothetical protein
MVEYDPNVIKKYAEELYARANKLIKQTARKYSFIGGIIGTLPAIWIEDKYLAIISVLIFAYFGYKMGKEVGEKEAFQYKLDAQLSLCQLKIEENTRKNTNL